MPFTLLHVVRVANNIRSKFSEFSIDYNTNLSKMAQKCTPEVTSRQMKFLTALREKGHCLCCTFVLDCLTCSCRGENLDCYSLIPFEFHYTLCVLL